MTRGPTASEHLRVLLALLVVGALAFGSFASSIPNGFVLDDARAIHRNRCVVALPGPACAFASDFWGRPANEVGRSYRPLVVLSFAFDWRLGGGRPLVFHLVNVFLHVASCLMLFFLLRRLRAGLVPSLAGAALFATLAVHTDAVSAIVGRADLLATLVGLFTVWLALPSKGDVQVPRWRLALSGGCFGLALLCHELAVLVPVLLLGAQVAVGMRGRARLPALALATLVTVAYLGLRIAVLGRIVGPPPDALNNPAVGAGAGGRLLLGLELAWRGLAAQLWPARLSAEYGVAEIAVPQGLDAAVALGAGALFGLALVALLARGRNPLASAGALLLLASLVLLSNTIVPMPTAFAERLLYLPSVGLALLVAGLVQAAAGVRAARFAALALIGAAAAGNGVVAMDHGRDYRDSVSLFSSAARARPRSARAQLNLGLALNERGRHAEAIPPLERALAIVAGLDAARLELAIALDMTGQRGRAGALLEQVFRARPRDPHVVRSYAVFLLRGRQLSEAVLLLEQHLRERPADHEARRLLEKARGR